MDIHRTRFVPYPASAINALAFSHTTVPRNLKGDVPHRDPSCLRLAIGRANGNIEIWNPAGGAWVHEITLYGGKERSIEDLAWIQEPEELDSNDKVIPGRLRLFSIGYSNTVTEWDLHSGLPLRHSGGNHSDVWCLAAQTRWEPRKRQKPEDLKKISEQVWRGQNIVIGCADGTLAVLSTADDDLQFQKFLARPTSRKSRVLSVTYKNRDIVVAGYANGTVGIYNAATATHLRNISLGPGPKGGPKDVLVWAVKALPSSGDIVVGDSTGEIRFYDGKNYSQLARVSAHDADVLTIAVGQHTKIAFSGSMDRRSAAYTSGDKANSKWKKITQTKYHEHDVKAMAVYEGKDMNVVVSGGLDVGPIVVPMRQFGQQYHLSLPITPQNPPIASASKARLIVSWWDQEARIWQYPEGHNSEQVPKLLARIGLKGEESVSSGSIDENGKYLALSTAANSRVFQISYKEGGEVRFRRLEGVELPGARYAKLSSDGKWLALITNENSIQIARIVPELENGKKARILPRLVTLQRSIPASKRNSSKYWDGLNGSWGRYDQTLVRVEFSEDGRVLVTADLAGNLDVFLLQGHEDSTAPEVEEATSSRQEPTSEDGSDDEDDSSSHLIIKGQSWIPNSSRLPQLKGQPLVMSIRPSATGGPSNKHEPNGNPAVHPTRNTPHPQAHDLPTGDYHLFIVDAQHRVYEFDVLSAKLTDWSRRNPESSLPPEFSSLKHRIMGCFWDVTEYRQRVWLYGSSWLFMFNLATDLKDNIENLSQLAAESDRYQMIVQSETKDRRKRFLDVKEWQKDSTGAGDRIPDDEIIGLPRKMRKITRDADGRVVDEVVEASKVQSKWQEEQERKRKADTMNDEDFQSDEDQVMEDLPPIDRESSAELNGTNGALLKMNDDEGKKEKRWWNTHKYRPILGIVPLQSKGTEGTRDSSEEPEDIPEVVLVERPLWDLDLPPKFMGAWEK